MKKVSQVLGLDISLTGTGVVLLDLKTGEELKTGVVTSKPCIDFYERCFAITNTVLSYLQKTDETFVICEGFAFGAKGCAVFNIAQLSGILRADLRRGGIPFSRMFLVPPTTIKSYVCGKGNALKELMLKEVYKRWGFDNDDNNVVDAYAIAQYGRALLGWTKSTKEQRKVMDKLLLQQGINMEDIGVPSVQ